MDWSKVTVIELANVLAGPSVGQWLAELGATIIKVENPATRGDVTRGWKLSQEDKHSDKPAYFTSINWGKQSIGLNMKAPESKEILDRLFSQADIVLSSFIPGQAEGLGLEVDEILTKHPELIWAEINGYGSDMPRAAYDAIIQAEAGFTYMNGTPGHTSKMPVALMDVLAAHQLKEGILLALLDRQSSGKGRRLSVSLLESGISSLVNQASNWLNAGHLPEPKGSDHPNIVPYGTQFTCLNGERIVLAVGSDKQFAMLCEVLGQAVPESFLTNQKRVENRQEVVSWLQGLLQKRNREELLRNLYHVKVPAGAVKNLAEVFQAQQAKRLLLSDGESYAVRQLITNGIASHSDLTSPPSFHQHGVHLLQQLGYTADQIHQLELRGVIPQLPEV